MTSAMARLTNSLISLIVVPLLKECDVGIVHTLAVATLSTRVQFADGVHGNCHLNSRRKFAAEFPN
jgi:hypothetical protein